MELFWSHVGSFGDHLGVILGSYWDNFGIILGSCWDRVGISSGSFRGICLILGWFRDRFRIIL